MKKQICLVMAAMMAAGMLAGCSGSAKETTAAATEAATTAEETKAEETTAEETTAASGEETEILVAAAASLKNAYEDKLIPMFEEANPGVTVKGTYDSSGKLQTQIEEGLDADVFMSAATEQMNNLVKEKYISKGDVVELLENKVVLIAPKKGDAKVSSFKDVTKADTIVPTGNEKKLEKFEDIENADSIALGDPASVPAGQYAQEALTNLGIWDKIQDKVSFGTNVTEVLNQVAAASADAGIVYATDAASMADQVEVVAEAPEGSLAKKVIYPVAVVKGTAHEEVAKEFVAFLQTDKAITVFEEYGFSSAQ